MDGMTSTARGTFDIAMTPGSAELDGAVGRFELSKTWRGDLAGSGIGVMLSAGNPSEGEAGYLAIETVTGRLGDRNGGFAFQQFGTMHAGSQTQYYEIVPGSGSDQLAGIGGVLHLTVDEDGTHHYELEYDL